MTARFLSLAFLVAAAMAQDDGGDAPPDFGNMPGFGDKPCPNFRCTSGHVPVQKSRAKFESKGCSSMGGGMMMMGAGMDGGEAYSACCDQWHACYQTCGAAKKSCDDAFKPCAEKMCMGDPECKKAADMSSMMLSMGGCKLYDQGQYSACECVVERKVEEKRAAALRSFYKKYSPENVDKADSLAKKADSKGKMAALLRKLVAKYPKSIKVVLDEQQKMYQDMMKNHKPKDDGGEGDYTGNVEEEIIDEL